MLTPQELGIWEDGYISGRRDFGALLIEAFIELGHSNVKLNELRIIMEELDTELPVHYIGERVQELLAEHHEERKGRSEL